MRFHPAHFAALLVTMLFVGPAAAGQEGTDMKLEDMGFIMRPATTPTQMERLRLLPPRKFVRRTKGDRRYYLYADPDFCRCVFVGNELAMKNYQALVLPSSAPPMPTGARSAEGPGMSAVPSRAEVKSRYWRLVASSRKL